MFLKLFDSSNLDRSNVRSANFIGRSDNLDVITLMNERKIKWTWDKFVVPQPESELQSFVDSYFDWRTIAAKLEHPELVADEEVIRDLVSFPDAEKLEVRFFPMMARALVVVFGCEAVVTLEDIRRINRTAKWDVMIVSDNELNAVIQNAIKSFLSIEKIPIGLTNTLIENGVFHFDDISVIDPDWLAAQEGMNENSAGKMIEFVDRNIEP